MAGVTCVPAAPWRQWLQQQKSSLRTAFEQDRNTAATLRRHAGLIDHLLRKLWREARMPRELALVAVGGYGRKALFPHSDIDLLILLPETHGGAHDVRIEPLVGLFWDIGLALGHSVRTIEECRAEAAADITVQTSLLEARLLAGHRHTFTQLVDTLATGMDPIRFLAAKKLEQQQRHARFNDSAYHLEPNIKESPGGLRDLQTLLWISKSLKLGDSWSALAQRGLMDAGEARALRCHELFLKMLRMRLHYLAGRREDRLLFDFQDALAAQLDLGSNVRHRASEQLMQRYYRTAKHVRLMNEILLLELSEQAAPRIGRATRLNASFTTQGEKLQAHSPDLFQRNPRAIFDAFLLLQRTPELQGMDATTLRALWRARHQVNARFRADPENRQTFLEILRQPERVTATLRHMNRYGILDRYIPAFGRISGQMQHDLFHIYTVDEHTLKVLRNLRRFAQPEHNHEFPLCSRLMQAFQRPELLYLAALFHDIAKGRGGDHSTLGAVDALRFCRAHALPHEEAALVSWLVKQHLLLSRTAQKYDLSDPAVIQQFAHHMQDERHLTALYLLTVADICGTSPEVWSSWKANLLQTLFNTTRRLLTGTINEASQEAIARQIEATAILNHYAIPTESYRQLWNKLGNTYFLRFDSREIAWHTRMLLRHDATTEPVVRTRLSPAGDGILAMAYLADRDDIFARICSFFDRAGYNIVEARIHTTQYGYALDSFLVLDEGNHATHYRDLLRYIEHELTQQLAQTTPVQPAVEGRISRQSRYFPMPPQVQIEPEPHSGNYQVSIVAGDRPGLLSHIACVFLQQGIRLHNAKINTLGNRAEDSFIVSARNGGELTPQDLNHLEQVLLAGLGAP